MTTIHNHGFFFLWLVIVTFILFWSANLTMAEEMGAPVQAYALTAKDAEALVNRALVGAGAGNEVKAHINNMREDDTIATGASALDAQLDGLALDKAHSQWQATLFIKENGHNLAPVQLSGRYEEMAQVPVLKKQLAAGDVISAEDIEWSAEPSAHIRKNTVIDIKDLIGKSPKRMISQGRPIRHEEVASPAIINKGAHITLLYKTPALEIKTLGEAMDSGAKGDVIRVKNVASKSVIQGTIEAGDRVRVTAPDSTSASAEAM